MWKEKMSVIDHKNVKTLLQKQIQQIDSLKNKPRFGSAFIAWKYLTSRILMNSWGSKSPHVKKFKSIRYTLSTFSDSIPESEFTNAFQSGLESAKILLKSFLNEIINED
jgi:hypothetical protein